MISIIIIVKNDRKIERLLKDLESVRKPEKTEVLIVDASKGTLDDIKKKFPSFRWIYFHNKTGKKFTYAEQRNLGIKKAKGDLIVFVDSDCIPLENWLINLIKPIREEGESIVGGVIKSTRKFPKRWDEFYKKIDKVGYFSEAPNGNIAYKKSVVESVGFYDENTLLGGCEDSDFSLRVLQKGYKIKYNKHALVYHDWGDIHTNIKRVFVYGERRFYLYIKYPNKVLEFDNIITLIYSFYIILFPLTIFYPYYPLFILLPFIKNIFERTPLIVALDCIFFNIITSMGIINGGLRYIFTASIKNLKFLCIPISKIVQKNYGLKQ